MKNFRKTIIALATVAAMLVPSAAMATTLTTTVDKDITGDVYVGFYDGAILKDVVKTTVDDITVSDATPAGTEEELPCTVEITTEEVGTSTTSGATVYKLVFTATAEASITALNMMMSYDDAFVELVSADEYMEDIPGAEIMAWESGTGKDYTMVPYTLASYTTTGSRPVTTTFTAVTTKSEIVGDRVATYFTQQGSGKTLPLNNGLVVFELYYRLEDGKTVDGDTFKIETEIGAGTVNDAIGSKGAEVGIKLASAAGSMTYGAWNNGTAVADTIKLVTPWDVQESTTKDLEVTVPTGAEGYKATMFIWDADQIAQCDPIALN